MGPTEADFAAARQQDAQRSAQQMQSTRESFQAQVRATSLPANYQQLIDAEFVATLKDPESRKIVYGRNPYGSLVCGTLNARNSYGGYTGQQPFHAYFTATGKLAELLIYSPSDVEGIRAGRQRGYSRDPEFNKLVVILEDCHLL